MTVTFIGHRELPSETDLEERIKTALLKILPREESVSFYCGGYGEFDLLCAKVCRTLKSELPQSELVYISPYITLSQQKKVKYYLEEGLYDSALYPPLETVSPQYAIRKRNEWMILKADLILSYVMYPFGGANQTLQFAKKRKKNIIELVK